MSLGILGGGGQSKKMARPLAFAPVGRFSLRGLGNALGASTLPGNCWDAAGFKDCHAKQYAQAQSECAAGMAAENYGGDMDTCVERNADAYAWAACVGKYCPQDTKPKASGASTFSWRNTSPNATVKKLQNALNPYLKKLGANTIAADGLLGSGTCGAAYWVDGVAGTTFYTDYGLANICKALTMPTKAGTKTPVQTISVAPQTTITKTESFTEKAALPWDVFDADTAEVQKRLNVQLDASDMNLLNTGGVLDAPTCGAMRWAKDTQGFDLLTGQGQNCQGFTAPTKRIKASTPVVVPSPSSVTPSSALPQPTKTSQASMATTGLVVGLVGLGIYGLGKWKHWF
ncbi:MAG TPA: hypothetical protein VHQ87_05125 [Rhizobacter sp.]|nr:hypothetical protein [Rhizobacter sp.]